MTNTFFSERRTTCKSKQTKKHYTQMTKSELDSCINNLRNSAKKIVISEHLKNKCKVFFNIKALLGSIHKDDEYFKNIIEYNQTKVTDYNSTIGYRLEHRILVRHPQVVIVENKKCYQYVVLSINNDFCKAITMYYNKVTDTHDTLNMSYYDEVLVVPSVMR